MNTKYVILFLLGILPVLGQSQVFDFRNGSIETKKGVLVTGKIGYNITFPSNNHIRIKNGSNKSKINFSSIERFRINELEYRIIEDSPNSGSYRAALVLAKGEIEVIESQGKYFIVYQDSTYFLDNSKKEKQVGQKIRVTRSGLYMVTLSKLFEDCQLDFSRISIKLNQKTLLNLLDDAALCRDLQFAPTRKRKRWQIGMLGGAGTSTFQSQYFLGGTKSNTMRFTTIGLTTTRDVIGINKLKFRADINLRNNQFAGSTVWKTFFSYDPLSLFRYEKTELANYNMSYSVIEVPIGFQYYLFKSKFGLYMNLGITAYSPTSAKLNVDGFELLNSEYIPRYRVQINARSNTIGISGYWGGGGFEFDLTKRLSYFMEFRYDKNSSIKLTKPDIVNSPEGKSNENLKFEELTCRFGVKINL